ncbi:putative MerR family transcriptional regulator [Paenibacillus sp. 598K]|nr:putative MerR family transcriptional regulator [Paenibacillus sp. 598K]
MRIGELAALTGVSVRSLRYYDKLGLLTPLRRDNGYRDYSPLAVEQVRTIQLYLDHGGGRVNTPPKDGKGISLCSFSFI